MRIYKICVVNNLAETAGEMFAVKPYLETFDSFKDEIFIRMPELKSQALKIYYQDADGDHVTIFNALDFDIFKEQGINKVFVVKSGPVKTVQFQEKPTVASTASTSAPNRAHHANVICDSCDKEIYGYRYKCLECHDFDLCMECEPKSHNHHLMIRIADPQDAEICYKSKLGKRFLRHRRSESLCSKPEEKIGKHHHHHKRHASSVSVRPPHPFGDIVYGVLQSLAGTNNANQNTKAATNTAAPSQGSSDENQSKNGAAPPKAAQPIITPTSAPSYGFTIENPNSNPKPPCVPLKQSIDMLSHMAHNFAAMMDPFAAYMDQSASASASSAATAAATAATAAAATTASAASATNSTNTAASSANTENESMTTDQEASTADKAPNKVIVDAMVIDCSDDEDEDLRNLVTSLHVAPNPTKDNAPEANKKDESVTSIDNDKGSPTREWTFIERNEIADSAGTSVSSTGAIPKKSTPPQQTEIADSGKVDYAELSRLLNTHINAQKEEAPIVPPQTEEKAKADSIDNGAKSTKTPPPTPMHPDARVNEALTAMMAMGFSNEGGWLSQLLETVDGSISNALDLLQPQK
ncbi:protein ref(2)P-like [Sitodiplosis mosellana]|uniref:protein ref(2)P-like n=1 Tax=Sitodiplosis mosellana TaxID=263140 RepID=UPI00244410AE|nr:protein ref(2)P-like [Sitodiplosis mosellana]